MPTTKSPSARLAAINAIFNARLNSQAVVTAEELRQKFGISQRTLLDDMDKLKSFGAPIEYIAAKRGSRYLEPFIYEDDHLHFTLEEVNQIRLANLYLAEFQKVGGFDQLPKVFEKMRKSVKRWEPAKGEEPFVFLTPLPKYEGTRLLPFFQKAIPEDRRVRFDYQAFHAQQPKSVLFDPYALREYDQRWYVLGHSHFPGEGFIRTFPLERIQGVPETVGSHPGKPKNYRPESYWENIVGISRKTGDGVEEVLLKFDAEQGKYFKTKPFYPKFEEVEETADSLTVRLEIIVNNEIVGKIASLGKRVKVLQPESLAEKVRSFFREALEVYA